mgnify:CR=1 FL=1
MGFHYTVESNKSIAEAIQSVEKNLQEIKFGVLWQTSITENLKNKGLTKITTPYHVLEVCSPFEAEKILTQNPMANYFLPCKITVYEAEGKTQIGFVKPTELMKPLNDPRLIEILAGIENQLIGVINRSK